MSIYIVPILCLLRLLYKYYFNPHNNPVKYLLLLPPLHR